MSAQEPVCKGVDGPDVRRVQLGQRRAQPVTPRVRKSGGCGRGELGEEALADPQAQLAGRLSRERDGGDPAEGECGAGIVLWCDHLEEPRNEQRRLARAGTGIDDDVAGPLSNRGLALRLIWWRTHSSSPGALRSR